ncbi:MAG: 2-vinyl bacteriochlorophyllide hydratase [Chloroflexota bacterium]|nr:2-vinyl bacteriochlorophyllide hydratase [Chloroflexota bacterium]
MYTLEQLERKAKCKWTIVQYIGAPLQILVFLISLGFVLYTFFVSDELFGLTNGIIVFKVLFLYFMFITGMLWEKEVIGKYYLSAEFFWEDVVSTWVLILHTSYVTALLLGVKDHKTLLLIILVAYVSYVINAIQYFIKVMRNRASQQLLALPKD